MSHMYSFINGNNKHIISWKPTPGFRPFLSNIHCLDGKEWRGVGGPTVTIYMVPEIVTAFA